MTLTRDGDIAPLVVIDDKPVTFYCRNCAETLTMVIDSSSGAVDWGAGEPDGGLDFGCGENSDSEGSGDHHPTLDTDAVQAYWRRQARLRLP